MHGVDRTLKGSLRLRRVRLRRRARSDGHHIVRGGVNAAQHQLPDRSIPFVDDAPHDDGEAVFCGLSVDLLPWSESWIDLDAKRAVRLDDVADHRLIHVDSPGWRGSIEGKVNVGAISRRLNE